MLLIFAFLANSQVRRGAYINKCLATLFQTDSAIETHLRILRKNNIPNPAVAIPAPKVSRAQRAIFYYADLVGTLVGFGLLIAVLAVWLVIGPFMSFNSNWWLLIGTYAGLIGMHVGFVLENVQSRLYSYVNDAFETAHQDDLGLLEDLQMEESVGT
jgi:low-affinity ferrous iron transport protein